jgi:signal transduction histidine kinase
MWEEKTMSWKRGKVLGVFEITQDVTHDYETIQKFRWLVVLGFLLFVGILFFTLLIIARRAEKIIATRSLERQRLEEQLHQSERLAALGEMIAGVSHEIRNPLGIIRSTAELLHDRIESDRQKRFSGIIIEEATRLNDILTEFLDFARPKNLHPIPGAIEEVLERNIQVLEAELHRLGVEINRDYQTGHFIFEADFDLLYRAFINLFANALQAMPAGGTLTVRTALVHPNGSSPQVEVTVQDTGPGISAEVRSKVFNPFFTTREKGTGLGLAIVKTIIDSHAGDIDIQSRAGEGTAIIVRLPVAQPEPVYELRVEAATA